MVYGRYNELVNGVYKPTNITGEHHPVAFFLSAGCASKVHLCKSWRHEDELTGLICDCKSQKKAEPK